MAIDSAIETLLNVKREHEQQKQHCDDCRILLMNCTNMHSSEWSILLDNLTAAHFKLGEILNELKRLEYTHIESGGHLPYPSISM
ncbi:hypothetical protein I4U23_018263 [Adineta vaga]|nr:hypothetical protein I4U23_018263 [Adineta vaga]